MTDQTQDTAALLRSTHAQIAALTRAATTDGNEISAPARKAFMAKFENGHECKHCGKVPIDPSLSPQQRARAVQAAISLHFKRLAMKSAYARLRAPKLLHEITNGGAMEQQLDTELGKLDDEC